MSDAPRAMVNVAGSVRNFAERAFDEAAEKIGDEEGAEVSDVGIVVNGRAAGIEGNVAVVSRDEGLDGVGEGVVEVEGHGGRVEEEVLSACPSACRGLRGMVPNNVLTSAAERGFHSCYIPDRFTAAQIPSLHTLNRRPESSSYSFCCSPSNPRSFQDPIPPKTQQA